MTDVIYMLMGILSCGLALKSFILPSRFFDGGTTGVSLVVQALSGVNLGYLVLPLNLPFILLGWRLVHVRFAGKTLACMVGLTYCLLWVPFPAMTIDPVLAAVFGGMFMGLGNGLVMRGGAAFDGFDVLTLYAGRFLPFSGGEISLAINGLIFFVAALTIGPEHALYSMVVFFVSSRVAEFVVEGLEEYTRVTIVSDASDAIKRMMVLELGRGITVYKGERGFLPGAFDHSHPVDIVSAVMTRLEVPHLRERVHEIDPKAFIVTDAAREADGGILRRHASY